MLVKILRRENPESEPYWQTFSYDPEGNETVGSMLDRLNASSPLLDAEGRPASPISWECSCMQKVCGACAMVINGRPALACSVFLKDEKEPLTLEPLSKFPTVRDLTVDRSIIEENLVRAKTYLGTPEAAKEKEFSHLYEISKCLHCGLCLEACPNYGKGENFFGALFANESYLQTAQSADRKADLRAEYGEHFAKGCSNALACTRVCPLRLPTLASIAKMNRRRT